MDNLKENPVLLDRIIQDIQELLKRKLPWLTTAYGKAHKLYDYAAPQEFSSHIAYPAAYAGGSEYISLMPDERLGNFSWIDIYDPQTINFVTPNLPEIKVDGAIIFWLNLDTIFGDNRAHYSEEIKKDIIEALSAPGGLKNGQISIKSVYENFENIYRGYSVTNYRAENSQFFMHPFCGLRFEVQLKTSEKCQR